MNAPDESDFDDSHFDRWLNEHLDRAVQDIEAGGLLRAGIRDELDRAATAPARRGRALRRWTCPVAAAVALILIVTAVAVRGGDGGQGEVATDTGGTVDPAVVLRGVAQGEPWSVVEYIEDDPSFVDDGSTCLRFDPPIEDGPFFCAQDALLGAHGRLVPRPGRFQGLMVFAGVLSSDVTQVVLRVDGQQHTVAPTSWAEERLGVAAIMTTAGTDAMWDIELRGHDGAILSAGGGDRADAPGGRERQDQAEQRRSEHREETAERQAEAREEARRQAEASRADGADAGPPQASGGVFGPLMYWRQVDGASAEEAGIEGVLELAEGCLYVRNRGEPTLRYPVLWHFDTRWLPDLAAVLLTDGSVAHPGDEIAGGGGYHALDGLGFFTTDADALSHARRCARFAEPEIAVLQGPAPSVTRNAGT